MKENDNVFEWMDIETTLKLTNQDVADIIYAIKIAKGNAMDKEHWNIYTALEVIKNKIENQWKDYGE